MLGDDFRILNGECSISAHPGMPKGTLQPEEPQEEEVPGKKARTSEGNLQINSETVVKEREWPLVSKLLGWTEVFPVISPDCEWNRLHGKTDFSASPKGWTQMKGTLSK